MSEKTFRIGLGIVLVCISAYWLTKSKVFAGIGAGLLIGISILTVIQNKKK